MTPEQLQQYVDAALRQRDQFNLVFYPLTVVLSIGGAWLFSYAREKGKNLATKEDISAITKAQEEIHNELANRSHFSRVRYDREMEIYQKVWPKLMNFYEVMVLGSNADPNSGLAYHKATNEVIDAVRENRPFFPKEIRQEVLAFQGLCENQRFSEFVIRVRELSSDEKKAFFESQEKMKTQLDKVEEAIRNRLIKFD